MAKIRIFEWAKENGIASNKIVTQLKAEGHVVKNHTSSVDENLLKQLFPKASPDKKVIPKTEVRAPKPTPKPIAQAPKPTGKPTSPIEKLQAKARAVKEGEKLTSTPTGTAVVKPDSKPAPSGDVKRKPGSIATVQKPLMANGHPAPAGSRPGQRPISPNYQGNRPNPNYQKGSTSPNYQGNRPNPNYQGGNTPRPNGGPGGYNNRPNGGPGGYNNRPNGGPGGYNNRPNGGPGGYNNRPNGGPGGYNNRPGARPAGPRDGEKPEVEQTSKPSSKKTAHSNANATKKKPYNNYGKNDRRQEVQTFRVDQRTKTQMKKEARREREELLKNEVTIVKWADDMTVGKFAQLLDVPAVDVISKLFELGMLATMNQGLSKESAEILCTDYNVEIVEDDSNAEFEFENLIPEYEESQMSRRAPIVTIMGHVDHGKTTLLDTIRKENVTAKESGGITQHIGAYQIKHNDGHITFLDTPGHAAFTAMRARGALVTDITVIVVAADDGVMPQTREAISHAKDAKTPIIVAVNKMDKEGVDPTRVMGELAELDVMSEEWGGDVPFVKISAKFGDGIEELLSYIDVLAEMHDYKAPVNVPGYGTVIEANLDKGRGAVATILVEGGDVKTGDAILIGHTYGNIRVMQDEYAKRHKHVGPSMPVEITGLKDVPSAGDRFLIMDDIKKAQTIADARGAMKLLKDRNNNQSMSLEELNAKIAYGEVKELPIILKADVQGAVEALSHALEKIDVNGVKVRIVHRGVGAINESDVMLAQTGEAIMIGFNVRPDTVARRLIEREKIDLMLSSIIYKIIEEIEDSMRGMREKKYREEILGYARVDEVFKITGVGKVAGCIVTEGKITRACRVRLVRDDIVVYDGELGQLKRFKDDVNEVSDGMDCGMSFKDFNDVKKGDKFEGYILEEEDLDKIERPEIVAPEII